jgi:hypothetical protein
MAGWRVYQADGSEIASFPISPSITADQVVWSADGAALLICQVEAGVGASVVRLDLRGATEILHSYPNVGFAYKACVSESPGGLTAISLSNLIVIVDAQQAEIGSVKGQSLGWRPGK